MKRLKPKGISTVNAMRRRWCGWMMVSSVVFFASGSGVFAQDNPSDDIQASSEAMHLRRPYTDCIGGGGTTTAELLKCASDEFSYQDKRLNRGYKAAMAQLSGEEKIALRDDERRWLKSKKERCALPVGGGTADQVASADCEVQETAKRATYLEQRPRNQGT